VTKECKKSPASLKSLLERVFTEKLKAPEITFDQQISKIWLRVVGKEISRHAEPNGLRNGILFIAVTHPLWTTELQYRSDSIRSKINELLDQELVKEIRFHLRRI